MTPSTDQFEKMIDDAGLKWAKGVERDKLLKALRSAAEAGALSMRERAVDWHEKQAWAIRSAEEYNRARGRGHAVYPDLVHDESAEAIRALPLIEPKTGG